MDEIFSTINKLERHRKGVPQFLLFDAVFGDVTIAVRKKVIEFKNEHPKCEEIDVIVNSPGGLADDAFRIIRTFRKNFKQVNIIVPFWAKSAATLLSLGGSLIVMDEFGEFGPLDAQLGKERNDSPEIERESALNDEHSLKRIETRFKEMFESVFVRLYEHKKINIPKSELSQQLFKNLSKFYEPLLKQIDPYKLGDKRRKLDIGGHYARRILVQFASMRDKDKIRTFIDFLVDGCPDHGYVIDYDLIKMFLDNVVTSKEFCGDDYSNTLSELSLMFMERDDSYTGFVKIPKAVVDPADKKTTKADVKSGIKIEQKTIKDIKSRSNGAVKDKKPKNEIVKSV